LAVGGGFSCARALARTQRSFTCPRGLTLSHLEKLIGLAIDLSVNRRVIAPCPVLSLYAKIGGKGGIYIRIEKPKGMHARTFKRVMAKVYAAEEIVDAHSDFLLDRVKRLGSH
jgi:hypothetical protein